MQTRNSAGWHFYAALAVSALALIAVIGLALPVEASPGAQAMLPSPTPFPVENATYTLETVGGAQETLTFNYEADGAIVPGAATATSHYPRGMVFTLGPDS